MKIQVPLTTDEITIEQYAKFNMVADDSDKEFVGHKMLSIFLDISMNDALGMEQSVAEETIKDLTDMLDATPSMKYTFMHEGVEYGFIPDLEKITLGEYVDLEDYLKEPKDWHKATAVMFRPITTKVRDTYDIEKYSGDRRSHEVAKNLPASCFINATVFFYNLSTHLLANSAFYLGKLLNSKEMESLRTTASKGNSDSAGDGSTLSTRLVTEMRRNLNRLLR